MYIKKNVRKHYHMFCAADESDWNNPEIHIERNAVTSGWWLSANKGGQSIIYVRHKKTAVWKFQLEIKWLYWLQVAQLLSFSRV